MMHNKVYISSLKAVLLLATGACLACSVGAQGFMVKPSAVETTLKPGVKNTLDVEVRNTEADRARTVDILACVLSQAAGGFQPAEPGSDEAKKWGQHSCFNWVTVDRNSLSLGPLAVGKFQVSFNVPASARGFYSAAILVRSRADPNVKGIGVRIQFLIPLLIRVEGSAALIKAEPTNPLLVDVPPKGNQPSGTAEGALVENIGEQLAHISGTVDLYVQEGPRWRFVGRQHVQPRRIIPGATVAVYGESPKRLPSGTYKMDCALLVDDQPLKPFSRELQFQGDPNIKQLASDVDITADPSTLEIQGAPGAARSAVVALTNPTNQPLVVNPSLAIPDSLQGVASGAVQGADFSAASWLSAGQPVTIGAYQTRKIRLLGSLPQNATRPDYFASLHLDIRSPDGAPLGTAKLLVIEHNKGVQEHPALSFTGPIGLGAIGAGKYEVRVGVGNTGDAQLDPTATGSVAIGVIQGTVQTITLKRPESAPLLPLGTAEFTGEIDATQLKPGAYSVSVTVSSGKTAVTNELAVTVAKRGSSMVIEPIVSKQTSKPKKGGK